MSCHNEADKASRFSVPSAPDGIVRVKRAPSPAPGEVGSIPFAFDGTFVVKRQSGAAAAVQVRIGFGAAGVRQLTFRVFFAGGHVQPRRNGPEQPGRRRTSNWKR